MANAQEAIPATGGNASGTGGTVSYSVGQILYTTITGTSQLLSVPFTLHAKTVESIT